MKKMIAGTVKRIQEVTNTVDYWKIQAGYEISARERFKIRDYLL